jgi:hypothetical protein
LFTAQLASQTHEAHLGGLSAGRPRDVTLPLSFLKAGRYAVSIWKDLVDAEADPNQLNTETVGLSSADALTLHLALDGGFVARLTPIEP